MQGKRLIECLSHLSGYHLTSRWKAVSTRPEEGKENLRLWHVETDEKDKKQVTRFLESMYNTNQRKLFPLGYKHSLLFVVKYSIGIHGMDKAQKLFDRQADFIKIHISVQVPGVKGAYYEDKRVRGDPWQIVSCLSNRRVNPNNFFIAWTKPKGKGRVIASASLICMTWKQEKSFTIWQHIWHITTWFGV
jgi:hypothetical protein